MTDIAAYNNEMDEDARDLVPQSTSLSLSLGPDGDLIYCSLASETRAERLAAYNMVIADSTPLLEMVKEEILVQHVIAHKVELTDAATGEMTQLVRIILITPEGDAFSCVSFGVLKCLKSLFKLVGQPPFDPPIKMVPFTVRTKAGRNVLLLKAIEDNIVEQAPAKK